MRKIWLFIILAPLVACALFVTVYFWTTPSGEPKLKIEFTPTPPWHIWLGQNLALNITIKNEGKALAKNVNINFTAPTGFIISQSGTNQYNENFAELKEGEIKNQTLTLTIPAIIKPGNYTFTVIFYAENAPKEPYDYQITVQLPH
jgi:hypothetical protein